MPVDFSVVEWDAQLVADCRELVRLALREDLGEAGDVTTNAVVGADRRASADVVSRETGVLAGVRVATIVLDEANADATWTPALQDGAALAPKVVVGRFEGNARDLLRCERVTLNLMSRLCGVATLTAEYVAAVEGSKAKVYDTRKTTPGWRRLEKHAVGCGGGCNHRTGLFDAVMLKDNHLAQTGEAGLTPAKAVERARAAEPEKVIEVEVDTLAQFREVLAVGPDIVLLDNMTNDELREAVALRNERDPAAVVLEASGGVRLTTISEISQTGVDRISVGALTHSAIGLDLGLDWTVPTA